MTTPTHILKLRDVTMQFDEKNVLDGLSLEVKPQDRLVIMGQSGSGKSTLLRLILGILRPNSGSIFFKQFEITKLSRRKLQRIRQHIGMVYQYSALLSSRTVRDNVALPLEEIPDKSRAEIDKTVDEKLDLVGMKDSKDLLPDELSGGMRKRVALARALVLEPELLLLDEPSAGLDPVIASVINELIISLSEKSKVTSITVTHEMESAFRIATRMAMLYQGKIIEEGEPEEFKQSKDPVVAQFISGSTEGPILEGSVEVQVDKDAKVYRDAKVRLMQLGFLGDMAIDFTQGTEASGRAKDGDIFAGERTPDLGDAAAKMLEVIKPVAAEATNTMKDLQQTAQNLNRLTDENSELTLALTQFKTFGEHLSDLTAPESALSHSLTNIEKISTSLTENDNIKVTLQNLRSSSEKLKVATTELQPAGENIKQFSETIKTQHWRLIWPSTKKYAEASPTPAPGQGTITVRKTARARARPSATPTSRTSSR